MIPLITIDIILFSITLVTSLGYVTLLSKLLSGWENTPEWKIPYGYKPKTTVTVVVAARNEGKNIKRCIQSIISNNYPNDLYEVILVDDESSDETVARAKSVKSEILKIIKSKINTGKKAALTLGIKKAKGNLIIVTDGDCIVPPNWVRTIVSYYEKSGARLIAGPIQYKINKSTIERFQHIDSINNMAVTANGIYRKSYFMANGANLAYEKSLFEELGGFSAKKNVASGDDMYMIQSAARENSSYIRFLKSKDAIVLTQPEKDISSLLNQRKRWATKTQSYTDKRIIKTQGYVFFFTLLLTINFILAAFGFGLCLFGALFGLFIKLVIDFMYLSKLQDFFSSKDALKSFFPASLMFLAYILIAGWWAIFPSKYIWKDRHLK